MALVGSLVVGGRSWVTRTPGWLALRDPMSADRNDDCSLHEARCMSIDRVVLVWLESVLGCVDVPPCRDL
ncbi:hypothetical protein L484_001425 [Morus notabilis]|uniref:Uncharacterized protein n=1 Tax=Morus notabilis TaxID=981085 RepID=W9SIK6_9ROSA|nr:hypothetical protein L484_001425 [Morus notabilis]